MEPIGGEVRGELGRFGPALGLAEVVAAWPEAVGPAIARNAWPARLARDGTLHVATSSSTWAFELTQLGGEIRARLAERLPDAVPGILRFAPGPVPEPGSDPVTGVERSVPTPSRALREEAQRIAEPIADPGLREAVARAAAASLAAAAGEPSDRSV